VGEERAVADAEAAHRMLGESSRLAGKSLVKHHSAKNGETMALVAAEGALVGALLPRSCRLLEQCWTWNVWLDDVYS
jgi:hypothetical protein